MMAGDVQCNARNPHYGEIRSEHSLCDLLSISIIHTQSGEYYCRIFRRRCIAFFVYPSVIRSVTPFRIEPTTTPNEPHESTPALSKRTWRRPFLQVSSERSSDSYTLGERRTQRPYFIKSPLSNVPNAALSESACDDRHLSGSYSDSQTPSSPLFLSSKQQFGRGELQLWF